MERNFKEHNEEVRKVWATFEDRKPIRVPVVFNMGNKMILLNKQLNTSGISYQQIFNNPEAMLKIQLDFQRWVRFHVLQDKEMGLPEKEWAGITIDFGNTYETSWLGAEIVYLQDNVPDTKPILQKNKEKLFDLKIPHPLMAMAYEFYQYFEEKRKNFEFEGKPIGKTVAHLGTDGPFTVACNLRGATELCLDIYEDPDYTRQVLDFVTKAIITRIKGWMDFTKEEYPVKEWGFADDSIELLSRETYREFVLPCHKRLINTFSNGGPNSIHLCGKAYHHFKTLKEELNIQDFDTGFPTDLGRARKELGTEVLLRGNINPELLRRGPDEKIEKAVKDLLSSGVMEGGKFILCDGSNVAPGTPEKHFQVMYETGRRYGQY